MLNANSFYRWRIRRDLFGLLPAVLLVLGSCNASTSGQKQDELLEGQGGSGGNGSAAEGGSGGNFDTSALRTTAEPPPNGLFQEPVVVTLKTNRPATTHFTIDGTPPNDESPVFRQPIALGETTLLQFFSVDDAGNREEVITATYKIDHLRRWLLFDGAQ